MQEKAHAFAVGDCIRVVHGPHAWEAGVVKQVMDETDVLVALGELEEQSVGMDKFLQGLSSDNAPQVIVPFYILQIRKPESELDVKPQFSRHPLLNRRVFVARGQDKGRLGEIRDASGTDGKLLVNLLIVSVQVNRRYSRRELVIA